MGEKKIVFVAALIALLTISGSVDGSPLCRYWLLCCCVNWGQYYAPVGPVPTPVPYQLPNYILPAGAPTSQKPTESNDLPRDEPVVQAETTPDNEPEENTETTEPPKGADPLPLTGPRVTRNSLWPWAVVKTVSVGYPQPVGNSRAEGYTSYPGYGAYKVHKVGTTWYDALRMCASEGGTLAVISSTTEAELVKTMFRPNEQFPDAVNNMHFWVGVQERGVDGQFYTVFGERLEQSGYAVWSPYAGGQPNDKGNVDCVSIFIEGAYFDDECTAKYAFVCKKILL